jgi:hypothetical protein
LVHILAYWRVQILLKKIIGKILRSYFCKYKRQIFCCFAFIGVSIAGINNIENWYQQNKFSKYRKKRTIAVQDNQIRLYIQKIRCYIITRYLKIWTGYAFIHLRFKNNKVRSIIYVDTYNISVFSSIREGIAAKFIVAAFIEF